MLNPGHCGNFTGGGLGPYEGTDTGADHGILAWVMVVGKAITVGRADGHGNSAETDYGNGPAICHGYNLTSPAMAG